jgi:hypothetical protein
VRFFLGALACGVLSGCDTPPAVTPVPASPPTTLQVTERGAEPRVARNYAFVVGKTDRRLVTIRQTAGRYGEAPEGLVAFAATADFTPNVVDRTATRFDLKILGVGVPDVEETSNAQSRASLGLFDGQTGQFVISSPGVVGTVDFNGDRTPNRVMLEQAIMELLVAPFPAEPIGVGASWEHKVERKETGGQLSRSYTLIEVSRAGAIVTADVELSVPKHPFQRRGVPLLATEEVKGKGSYRYELKFDHVSTKASGEMTIARRVDAPDGKGGQQSVTEVIKLTSSLDSAGAGPATAPAPKP